MIKKILIGTVLILILFSCSEDKNPAGVNTNQDNPVNTELDTVYIGLSDYAYYHYIRSNSVSNNLIAGHKTVDDYEIYSRFLIKFNLEFLNEDSLEVIGAELNFKKTADSIDYTGFMDVYQMNEVWYAEQISWQYKNIDDEEEWSNGEGALDPAAVPLFSIDLSSSDNDSVTVADSQYPELIEYIETVRNDSLWENGLLFDIQNAEEFYMFESANVGEFPVMSLEVVSPDGADTNTYSILPVDDTYIINAEPNISENYSDNQNTDNLTLMGGYSVRGLLKFDIDALDTMLTIPSPFTTNDVIINKAMLKINIDTTLQGYYPDDFTNQAVCYFLEDEWSDSTEVNYYFGSGLADIYPDSSAISINLRSIVQYWINNPSENNGLMMRMYNEINQFSKSDFIFSGDNAPILELIYSVPPDLSKEVSKDNVYIIREEEAIK